MECSVHVSNGFQKNNLLEGVSSVLLKFFNRAKPPSMQLYFCESSLILLIAVKEERDLTPLRDENVQRTSGLRVTWIRVNTDNPSPASAVP